MRVLETPVLLFTLALFFSNCSGTEKPEVAGTSLGNKNADVHQPVSASDSAAYISKVIEIKGEVKNVLHLTVDSLKKMKPVTLDEFHVVCQSGATVKTDKTSTGVLLKDILEKAELKQGNHKDRSLVIVARAADNYTAVFSWAEIFNNPTGQNTYVLYEENGKPIKEQGDMILVCANDIKTGPRHVIWLKTIDIARIN